MPLPAPQGWSITKKGIGHAYEYQTPKGLRIGYIKKVLANGCFLMKPLLRRAELPKVRGLLTGHPCSRWRASR